MVDVVLVIVMCVALVLMAVADALLIIRYQSRSDAAYAIPAKVVVALGLIVGECCVLLLPFDVANRTADGGLPTSTLWLIVYGVLAAFVVLVLPFVFQWYQNDLEDLTGRPSRAKRVLTTILSVLVVLVIFVVVCIVAYLFFGVAEVPVTRLDSGLLDEAAAAPHEGCTGPCGTRSGYVSFRISPVLFLITVIDFVGYLVLIIFGSIGLASVPYDLFWGFVQRPHVLSQRTYEEQKRLIYDRAVKLIEWGKELRDHRRSGSARKRSPKQRQAYNKWRAGVDIVDAQYKQLEELHANPGLQIVLGYAKLVLGILATVLSVAWWLHILLFLVVPGKKILFLNGMLIAMNNAWSFLGTVAYGVLAVYLLVCVIAGLFKFGLRFFCLFTFFSIITIICWCCCSSC